LLDASGYLITVLPEGFPPIEPAGFGVVENLIGIQASIRPKDVTPNFHVAFEAAGHAQVTSRLKIDVINPLITGSPYGTAPNVGA